MGNDDHNRWQLLHDLFDCAAVCIFGAVLAIGIGFAMSMMLGITAGMFFAMFTFVAFIVDQIWRLWPDVREIKRDHDRRKEEAEKCSKPLQDALPRSPEWMHHSSGLTKKT